MKIKSIVQAFFILTFFLIAQAHAATTYQLDDGTGDNNIGIPSYALPWVWMNTFDAVGGTDQITSVGIAWGSGADGLSARVKIWDDPNNDGSPSDRVELSFFDVIISGGGTQGTDTFSFYDIVDTLVTGSFFVGVEFASTSNLDTYPARIDQLQNGQPSTEGKSWVGTLDDTLPLGLIDSYFAGNWMIRANGSEVAPVPEPSTILMLGAGLLGLLAATRRPARQ